MTIPRFMKEQFDRFAHLFDPVIEKLKGRLDDLVIKIWKEFHNNVPKDLHDQINQYVAGYVHNIIRFVVYDMIDRRILAPPPEEGPLVYNLFFIDRPTD